MGKTENGLSGSERNETKDSGKQRDFHNQEEAFEAQLYVRSLRFFLPFHSSFDSRLRKEMNEKSEQFVCSGSISKWAGGITTPVNLSSQTIYLAIDIRMKRK